MKELAVRAASGAVYAALVLGAAWLSPWATAALFLLVCTIAARELHRLGISGLPLPALITVAVAAFAGAALLPLLQPAAPPAQLLIGQLALLLLVLLRAQQQRAEPLMAAAAAVAYLGVPFAYAVSLTAIDPGLFIGFMLLLWANDSGAYLVGKAIGRRKLMPAVSPGKTWEGFIGGMLLTLLLAWPISRLSNALPLPGWLIAAAGVAIASTIGDLWESALKRKAGVKDSGRIMPGHGGALDRFDGYLLAAPVMLLVVLLMRL